MTNFVDTNVWVYAFVSNEPEKHQIAKTLLAHLIAEGSVATSAQVINETYVVLMKKLQAQVIVRQAIEQIANQPCVVMDWNLISSAIDIGAGYQISHWDALLVAASVKAGCKTLYTEDLQHGQKISGVKIINPFKDATPYALG